ncbi:hemagglutinin [Polaromonas sp. SM01]|uniref:hemagglutinin n=1 Tax=Polaromonas sp. SM01 TaxID=3085630 RepID=UPI0029827E92|nr:hemagglutinin [Polaromonas sp. SM01]MDW5444301.1 hemagglutinin [Polaromonas sp. SM01]
MSDLRGQYESAVAALGEQVAGMLASGAAEEQVARWAVAQRNQLKQVYRGLTPPDVLALIEARTLAQYGNLVGPSVAQLRAGGKSWAAVAASAGRAGSPPQAQPAAKLTPDA